jgi:UDPglucose 6-dehydrogenase
VCLAARGVETVVVDADPGKLQVFWTGEVASPEPHLKEMLQEHRLKLSATPHCASAISRTDITFVAVPTPITSEGRFSLSHVMDAVCEIGTALREKAGYHVVVIVSTVMPGAMANEVAPALEAASGKRCGRDIGLCYSPGFVALGSVIRDLLQPDFVLVGASDERAGSLLAELYGRLCGPHVPIARTDFVNAEIAKLAINGYLTTKISFANMLARLCERIPGADVDRVTGVMGLDSRIGSKYLKGAVAFGGPCFPRDSTALASLSRSASVSTDLPDATDAVNCQQRPWLAALVRRHLPAGGRAGVLGLAYKPDTEVVEHSPGMSLITDLVASRVPVIAYDPAGMHEAIRTLSQAFGTAAHAAVAFASSALACIQHADVVVVTTPWEEFRAISASDWNAIRKPLTVIDCWRVLPHLADQPHVEYVPIGTHRQRAAQVV